MINFPLGFWDISLLLAFTALILLVSAELLSPRYGRTNILINRKRLKTFTWIVSILFLITLAIRVVGMVLNP